jgi:hypothetical protein
MTPEVFMAENIKTAVIRYVRPRRLIDDYCISEESVDFIFFHSKDRGTLFLHNTSNNLPDNRNIHPEDSSLP